MACKSVLPQFCNSPVTRTTDRMLLCVLLKDNSRVVEMPIPPPVSIREADALFHCRHKWEPQMWGVGKYIQMLQNIFKYIDINKQREASISFNIYK